MEEPRTTQNKRYELLSSEPDSGDQSSAHPEFFRLTVCIFFQKNQAKKCPNQINVDKTIEMSYIKHFKKIYGVKKCST